MSPPNAPNYVVGDEELSLHRLFAFANTEESAADHSFLSSESFLTNPALSCSPAWPLEDLLGQQAGRLSLSAAGSVGDLDAINFDDFLALYQGNEDLPAAAEKTTSTIPAELADSSTTFQQPSSAPRLAGDIQVAINLEAAQAELEQLKAALAVEGSREQSPEVTDVGQGCSARKRKSIDSAMSPPKRQITTQKGPIEALWAPLLIKDGGRAAPENLASPETLAIHCNALPPPSTPYLSNTKNPDFSTRDIQALQRTVNDDSALFHDITRAVTSTSTTMAHTVNTTVKRSTPKQGRARAAKVTSRKTSKVTKKPKATPKNTQYQRTTSTALSTSSPSTTPPRYRSIDELLSANFFSLNEQEKTRLLLPMLRNLDPRELESSLAELPCVQAKGSGHEHRVASAIRNSPPTEEGDDTLATKLTFGAFPSHSLDVQQASFISLTPPHHASPLSRKVSHIAAAEELGAMQKCEALGTSALLQAQEQK